MLRSVARGQAVAGQEGPLRVRDKASGRFVFHDMPISWDFSGIYRLEFPDGRFYIGSSMFVRKRLLEHKSNLAAGNHLNTRLQRGWNRFKEIKAFPLICCPIEEPTNVNKSPLK